VTPGGSGKSHARGSHRAGLEAESGGAAAKSQGAEEGPSDTGSRPGREAPAPASLTPALPPSLGSAIPGVPAFFIESFQVPPFLLPIYQAAGTAYGIPWQVLAAINEVETDYGRDLSVSSAGAEGWMQFLPATWARYGVDSNGDGFEDPYNPADAIFAAARYLRAAGGARNIRAAVYAYNHSQAYVASVMLRAQLLGGTPPTLLGAIADLTESRFPVHAPAHFADGFPTAPAHGSTSARTLAGTTIYTRAGAPVIAVQDGEVTQIGDSPTLGRFVALRDAYGNTYVYAQLADVATLYPVLVPHEHRAVSARIARPDGVLETAPSGPATAGAQRRSSLSSGALESGLALGAAAGLESAPPAPAPPPIVPPRPVVRSAPRHAARTARVFRAGPDDVYLRPLRVGVQVIAGTVLGHVGASAATTTTTTSTTTTAASATAPSSGATPAAASAGPPATAPPGTAAPGTPADSAPAGQTGGEEAHMLFQIKPAGIDAPLIDPKPILDGWVALEDTSIFRAKGENPFLATAPTVGQVLLESKGQLEQQIARDASIRMPACERRQAQTGRVDRRVLAVLEFLSVSGLKPAVAGLVCAGSVTRDAAGKLAGAPAKAAGAPGGEGQTAVKITAVNGTPIAAHQGAGSVADTLIRKLLTLQGVDRPPRIVGDTNIPGAGNVYVDRAARGHITVSFAVPGGRASAASYGSALSASEWVKLIVRLGEIPDPAVAGGPSAAALPDGTGADTSGASAGARPGEANGSHDGPSEGSGDGHG
jgi:murein DD-endopeptidase MepM/ murein hydrolase activator NlpD